MMWQTLRGYLLRSLHIPSVNEKLLTLLTLDDFSLFPFREHQLSHWCSHPLCPPSENCQVNRERAPKSLPLLMESEIPGDNE